MKPIKKTIAALALAAMLLPTMLVTPVQAEVSSEPGPVENYIGCAKACINSTPSWSWKRTVCATDCYISFIAELL